MGAVAGGCVQTPGGPTPGGPNAKACPALSCRSNLIHMCNSANFTSAACSLKPTLALGLFMKLQHFLIFLKM